MITLVKSESFKAFEEAYNKCFETTYKDDKAVELARDFIGRRMLKTQKDTFDLLNYKGISTERAVDFVDAVRNGQMDSREFINECRVLNIDRQLLVDLINDIGSKRVWYILKLARSKPENEITNMKLLQKMVLYTGLMAEIRINTYSLLGFPGEYDGWCKNDKNAIYAYEYFSELHEEYGRRITVCLKHSNAIDYGTMGSFDFRCLVDDILIGFTNGSIKPEEYTICDNLGYTFAMLGRLTTLIDGMCEWFWNED